MLVKQFNNQFVLVGYMIITDSLDRPLRDLRISVTDRCNFRCDYCMPEEIFSSDYQFLPRSKILSFEQINNIVKAVLPLGLSKVRITGGEPLLRKDIIKLIKMIRSLDSRLDIAMTTNGSLLSKFIGELAESGIDRITISLDAIDKILFRDLSGNETSDVDEIVKSIIEANNKGLNVKINTVIMKGKNDHQILPLIEKFKPHDIPIRFIEYMDVGGTSEWKIEEVMTGKEMRDLIVKKYGNLEKLESSYIGEVANNYMLTGDYKIGFIESVSNPFCGNCTRARISANGKLYTCLFSTNGHDIKSIIDFNATEQEISEMISSVWNKRKDQYSQIRSKVKNREKPVNMHFIGG